MSCVLRVVLPLLVVMATVVPVQADAPTCAAGDPVSSVLQDDAGSGTDASNRFDEALSLPEGDFYGMLQLPTSEGVGDTADWYRLHVGAPAEKVMAELDAYNAGGSLAGLLVIDVIPPGATEPAATVPLGSERAAFDGEPGEWWFRIRFDVDPGSPCASTTGGPGAPASLGALTRDYAFYIGCDPICL